MIPLAFRALARVTTNSPLSGIGYVTLTLNGPEPKPEVIERVRAPMFRREVVKTRNGKQILDAEHMVTFRTDIIAATKTKRIPKGSKLTTAEGVTYQIHDPVDTGGGEYRAVLIRVQDDEEA